MSSLPGDAGAGDPGGTHRDGTFVSTSALVPRDVVGLSRGAFTVHLPDRSTMSPGTVYRTDVVVELVDRHGRLAQAPDGTPLVLGSASFEAARAAVSMLPVVNTLAPLGGPVGAGQNATRGVQGVAHDPTRGTYDAAYGAACIPTTTPACDQLRGNYGVLTLRGCHAMPGNTPSQLFYQAFQPARDQGMCEKHLANETREAIPSGEAAGPLAEPLVEALAEVDLLPRPTEDDGMNWSVLTLDATPPAALRVSDDLFRIPEGLAIRVRINSTGPETTVPAPSGTAFSYGRPASPARVVLRGVSGTLFPDMLLGAERVGDGTHTGMLILPNETDDHQFPVNAEDAVRVTGNAPIRVYDDRGQLVAGGSGIANAAGLWTVRVGPRTGAPAEYTFVIEREPLLPQNDAGSGGDAPSTSAIEIPEGDHTGYLGAYDTADRYRFFAYESQRYQVTLSERGDLVASVSFLPGPQTQDGYVSFTVSRQSGSGAYGLDLWLDDAGDLGGLPALTTAATLDPAYAMGRLYAHNGGVEFSMDPFQPNASGIYRVEAVANSSLVRTSAAKSSELAWTSDDALVHTEALETRIEGGGPIAHSLWDFAFGEDGRLYGWSDGRAVAVSEDRSIDNLSSPRFPAGAEFEALPDGRILARTPSWGGSSQVYDSTNGTWIPAGHFAKALTFDANGQGYRVSQTARSVIERIDPETGLVTKVARAPAPILDLAFASGHLFAAYRDGHEGSQGIAFVDLGVAGFEGFQPEFRPRPAADLVATSLTDEIVNISVMLDGLPAETHRVQVTVRNAGGSDAGRFDVMFSCLCSGVASDPSDHQVQQVEGLAAGGSKVVEFLWRARAHVGDHELQVALDAPLLPVRDNVVESNETNNEARLSTRVIVGGNAAACDAIQDVSGVTFGRCRTGV